MLSAIQCDMSKRAISHADFDLFHALCVRNADSRTRWKPFFLNNMIFYLTFSCNYIVETFVFF